MKHDLKTKYFCLKMDGTAPGKPSGTRSWFRSISISNTSSQCEAAAKKVRSIVGMIHRQFERLNKQDFLIIYKAYVCPHMEYCIQAYSPQLKNGIKCCTKSAKKSNKNGTWLSEHELPTKPVAAEPHHFSKELTERRLNTLCPQKCPPSYFSNNSVKN